jgi:hypothetical protein
MVVGLAGAGTAHACNEPKVKLLRPEAKAGDLVPFEISDIDEGAAWELTLNHETVASGVDNDGRAGVRGQSFTMPALRGATRTVYVMLSVRHEDGAVTHHDGNQPTAPAQPLRFNADQPPPPPPPPANADPAPTPQPRSAPPQVGAPTKSRPKGVGGTAPVGGTGGLPPTGPAGSGGGPPTPSSPVDPSGDPLHSGAEAAAAVEAPIVAHAERPARAERPVAEAVQAGISDSASEGAADPALRAATAAPAGDRSGSGWVVLVLAGATLGGLAGAMVLRRRRGGAGQADRAHDPLVPHDPAVEAELQEIIAEERAKVGHVRDDRPPAEVAAARDDPG